ncbi:MAG: TetR/AcrR family transcriptional regulator [Parasphingopyxis sp.]|uniref:TetR/AcrR family transcriptional regulator n=1 Tax=Parasphingopyxis sp. TaxID=1920299 RepID=UPI003F9ECCB1
MRPSSLRKIDAILDAARQEFFAHGLGETTIEAIARRADVSKVTIYNQFGGKDALFSQVIHSECQRMRGVITAKAAGDASLRETLLSFGDVMLTMLTNAEVVRFERILAAEAGRDPKIGERFLASGPSVMRQTLADILAGAAERGELELDDPALAAEQLGAMIKGFLDVELRFGQSPDISADARAARIESAVDAFLRAYGERRD